MRNDIQKLLIKTISEDKYLIDLHKQKCKILETSIPRYLYDGKTATIIVNQEEVQQVSRIDLEISFRIQQITDFYKR
jgi:hypothetical protein